MIRGSLTSTFFVRNRSRRKEKCLILSGHSEFIPFLFGWLVASGGFQATVPYEWSILAFVTIICRNNELSWLFTNRFRATRYIVFSGNTSFSFSLLSIFDKIFDVIIDGQNIVERHFDHPTCTPKSDEVACNFRELHM